MELVLIIESFANPDRLAHKQFWVPEANSGGFMDDPVYAGFMHFPALKLDFQMRYFETIELCFADTTVLWCWLRNTRAGDIRRARRLHVEVNYRRRMLFDACMLLVELCTGLERLTMNVSR